MSDELDGQGGLGDAAVAARERRLRPLGLALVLPLLVVAVGGGLGLRAHFSSTAGDGGGPPARENASMVFDAGHGVMVLFGGSTRTGVLGDTWTWDGDAWTEQHPATSPAPREAAAMAYDEAHHQVVLFGGVGASGQASASPESETWTWDGSTWHHVTTAHVPVILRAGMVDDPATGQLLLVGESMVGGFAEMQAQAPSIRHLPPGPCCTRPPGGQPIPAPVPVSGSVTAHTLTNQDSELSTWVWTGSDWSLQSPRTRPSSGGATPAWDSASRRVVLVTVQLPQACAVAEAPAPVAVPAPVPAITPGAGWSGYSPISTPPTPAPVAPPRPASCAVIAYDDMSVRQWSWDGSTWQQDRLGQAKPPQHLVADAASGGLLGVDAGSSAHWDARAKRWVETRFPTGLANRFGMAVAGDTERHQVVLFGGRTFGSVDAGDTWTWDGHSWTHRAGAVPPPSTPRPLSQLRPLPPATPGCGPMAIPEMQASPSGDGLLLTVTYHGVPSSCGAAILRLESAGGGGALDVQGNGVTLARQATQAFLWSNWCGAAQTATASVSLGSGGAGMSLRQLPACTDRAKPSTLVRAQPAASP